jgi:hypothetical protein
MFSWHPLKNGAATQYAKGFKFLGSPELDDEYSFDYISKALTKYVWSPIKFDGGIRLEKHFLGTIFCALDFDSPATTLEWALVTFKDHTHIIGTTKSHQKEKNGITCDRFRVVLMFEDLVTDLHLYKYNMEKMILKHKADRACKDGARFFYPCKEIVSIQNGVLVKVEPLPVVEVKKPERHTGRGLKSFVKVTPAPENRNASVFKLGCKLFRTNIDRNDIVAMLTTASNGLPEAELQRTIKRAEEYAKK